MTRPAFALAALFCALLSPLPASAQVTTTFTWADAGTAWNDAANWTSNPDGFPNSFESHIAEFANDATITNQPTIGTGSFTVHRITINNAGADYNLVGSGGVLTIGGGGLSSSGSGAGATFSSANIQVGAAQTWDVVGDSLEVTGSLSGAYPLTKTGGGQLVIDSATTTPSTFFGGFVVNGGMLLAGRNAAQASSQVLRSNPITLGAAGVLSNSGASPELSIGQLNGSGAVTLVSNSRLDVLALSDATYSGPMFIGGTATSVDVRGGTGATQTFNGNMTGITPMGGVSVGRGTTLRLAGTGDSTSGVLGPNTGSAINIVVRGGTFLLDNAGGNTSASNGRLNNADAVTLYGGSLTLVGHSSGTTEVVGNLLLNASATNVRVTNNSSSGAQLTFGTLLRTGSGAYGVVNFVGDGTGTLGSAGANPRITFATAPTLINGVIGIDATQYGFATVNGSDFATYGANGVAAVSSTLVSGALASNPSLNARITGSATIAAADVLYNTLKIAPSASGQSLDLTGAGGLQTSGILLTGTIDYTIRNTGAGTGRVEGQTVEQFIRVSEPGTTLNISASVNSSTTRITKSGPGFLALTRSSAQLNGTTDNHLTIAEGVVRASLVSLGGGAASGGPRTTISLRGGVLEISGGGTLMRALYSSTGSSAGGAIDFDPGSNDYGGGGFSAFGGAATVTFTVSPGNSTPASGSAMRWGGGEFVPDGHALMFGSTKADSVVTLTNTIGLDDGAATNPYRAREIYVNDNPLVTTDAAALSGSITGSAFADLLKTGPGELRLTAVNAYGGNTLIQQGVLVVENGSAIPNTSAVLLADTAGAALKLSGNERIGALHGGGTTGGNVNLQNFQLSVGDVRNTAFAGQISGSGGVLVKLGAGRLTLTGENSYSGGTTVSEGTLLVNNANTVTGSGTGLGDVVVSSGATVGGTGRIAGSLTLNGASTLAPGASTGTLTVDGNLVLNASSVLAYELNALDQTAGQGVNDLVTGVNILTLAGVVNVTAATADSFLDAEAGDAWRLINYSGALSGTLAVGTAPALDSGLAFTVVAGGGAVNLVIVLVPDAPAFLFMGLACAAVATAACLRRP